jgi:adenylate cyclase
MARLSLSFLGPFQVTLDGQPVTSFKSNKVRALLAYLAVEADRPHRREVLAGLLWPDWPDRDALSNLRNALSNLRRVIGDRTADPPFLLISRASLQFNVSSDHWLDVAALAEANDLQDLSELEMAIARQRGSFLEGFSLGDSAAFEEWALFTRERLARRTSSALHQLAATYEQRGEYERAVAFARRQLELEPWDEDAHQQLMRALALGGQRSGALAQYENCRRMLAEELGVEPAPGTTQLYEQIKDGRPGAPAPVPRAPDLFAAPPRFLEEGEATKVERPVFVARERELAQLDSLLDLALSGQGRVVFVTGETGSGKTALIQEFTLRAQEAHADLVAVNGNCNAYTGIGDPYLPFREILELLTGDVEARWAAGAISGEHARRLWSTLPLSAQALTEAGPNLIGTFVPPSPWLEHAMGTTLNGPHWQASRDELTVHRPLSPGIPSPRQSDLFEQYTKVLHVLARQVPLVLVIDDLQWADLGSISLLFHLGRRLAGSRILVVGAYRPEELAIGREGGRHPLDPVVNELQRDLGNITVDLGQAENQGFVDALLDSEPNRLGLPFREMLFRQTQGHPLFTGELLRGLQERGDLVPDEDGHWIEGPTLDWETLPARVEAVIAERIGRLAQPLRAALRVACVEGVRFTAEVVARVQATDERRMLERLSGELDRRHHLICAQSIQRVDSQLLSTYRFRHILFQRYLYSSLDEVERVHSHEQVGTALEVLHGASGEDTAAAAVAAIAPQLALHFLEARISHKAIHYLHQAGERAIHLSAYQEAIAHYSKGLDLVLSLPDSPDRAEQELALQVSLGIAWKGNMPDPEGEIALTRARELCERTGKTTQLRRVLAELAVFPYVRAEHLKSRELGEEALRMARLPEDPLLRAVCHWHLGYVSFALGEYATAREHLQRVVSFYEPSAHHQPVVYLRGSDAGVSALAYDACCLWCLGYPDQALKRSQEAVALARELDHTFSLIDVLCFAGCVFHGLRRDAERIKGYAEELTPLSKGLGSQSFWGTGTCYRGQALAMLGQVQDGIAQMRAGLAERQSIGVRCYSSGISGALAEALAQAGDAEGGLSTLDEALVLVEETSERYFEAELHRLKGELLLAQGEKAEAESTFHKAVEVARCQTAKSWELRATISLARLWWAQEKTEEARQALTEIYHWFTEGFDTPDLLEAKALLEELELGFRG